MMTADLEVLHVLHPLDKRQLDFILCYNAENLMSVRKRDVMFHHL